MYKIAKISVIALIVLQCQLFRIIYNNQGKANVYFVLKTQHYNNQYSKKQIYYFWTDLKQNDKDHYSDWSQLTEIVLKVKFISNLAEVSPISCQ